MEKPTAPHLQHLAYGGKFLEAGAAGFGDQEFTFFFGEIGEGGLDWGVAFSPVVVVELVDVELIRLVAVDASYANEFAQFVAPFVF